MSSYTRITYNCYDCHARKTVPVWDEERHPNGLLRSHTPLPVGWAWDYTRGVRTGVVLCPDCKPGVQNRTPNPTKGN